jgi:hypothetical protein
MRTSLDDPSGAAARGLSVRDQHKTDIYSEEQAPDPGVAMALPLIALTWMLLLSLVVGLCRAARLGDGGERAAESTRTLGDRRPEDRRRTKVSSSGHGRCDAAGVAAHGSRAGSLGGQPAAPFTKSLRRRAGLRRA